MYACAKSGSITWEELSVTRLSERCTSYHMEIDTQSCAVTVHRVFPGIYLAEWKVQNWGHGLRLSTSAHVLTAAHCQEGSVERKTLSHVHRLEQGDAAIWHSGVETVDVHFPNGRYRGIDLIVVPNKARPDIGGWPDNSFISIDALAEKAQAQNGLSFRQDPRMDALFSLLYSVPESVKEPYQKLKCLELLLFFTAAERTPAPPPVPERQLRLAQDVHRYLLEHMTARITIEQLSQTFNVSPTHLKACFKEVYGVPIQTFVSQRRLRASAEVLLHTDRTVADIAVEFGYANASKFSAAFRRVMGESPSQYRVRKRNREWSVDAS